MPNYAPRLSMSFMELSSVFDVWGKSCESMVVYEHPQDTSVKTTHCHVLMINSKYATAEQYKRQFHELVKTDRKGNALWEWEHKEYGNPDKGFIKYMTKGKYAPKLVINLSKEELEQARLSWTTTPVTAKETKDKGEFDLLLVAAEAAIKAKKLTVSMSDIACFIKSHYLRRRKAVPRKSDTNRYAYSIYAIVNELCHENLIEQIDRQALIENIEF